MLKECSIPWDPEKQNIINDMGCGAFAMLWGIVYHLVYRRVLNSHPIPRFYVRLIDNSRPMQEIGKMMYKNLCDHAEQGQGSVMEALRNTTQAITFEAGADIDALTAPTDRVGVTLTSGIHALYPDGGAFHESIIRSVNQSDYGIFSYDNRITNERRLQAIENFVNMIIGTGRWDQSNQNETHKIGEYADGEWCDSTPLREFRINDIKNEYDFNEWQDRFLRRWPPTEARAFNYHYFSSSGKNTSLQK